MQLFFNPDLSLNDTSFTFDPEESKHIVRVLRKSEGDPLQITDGKGHIFHARIETADPSNCRVTILNARKQLPKRHHLHLAVAPTKNNNRFEWFVEKATEIGAHEITPLICDRSEKKHVKLERLQKLAVSAMKQSLRTFLPVVNEPMTFKDFIKTPREGSRFIAHCEEEERSDLKRRVTPDTTTTILIGPEGDFTEEEIKSSYGEGYIPVTLGEARLRTETAALVACTIVTIINNG